VTYGILCVIAKLEFFQHHFAKMGHRNTSCDPHLHSSHQATNAPIPHAKRPPPGGYVLNEVRGNLGHGTHMGVLPTSMIGSDRIASVITPRRRAP